MGKNPKKYYLSVKSKGESHHLMKSDLRTFDELTTCFDNYEQFSRYIKNILKLNCGEIMITYIYKKKIEKVQFLFKEDRIVVESNELGKIVSDYIISSIQNYKYIDLDKISPYIIKQIDTIKEYGDNNKFYRKKITEAVNRSYRSIRTNYLLLKNNSSFPNLKIDFIPTKDYVNNLINLMGFYQKCPLLQDYVSSKKQITLEEVKPTQPETINRLQNTLEDKQEIEEAEKELNNPDVLRALGLEPEDEELYDNSGRSR